MERSKRSVVFLVLNMVIIEQLAFDIYLPSFPTMAVFFSVDSAYIKLTLSLYLLGFGSTPIIFGPLSEIYGRKKLSIIGLLIYSIASLGCFLSTEYNTFVYSRFFQGVGSGALVVTTLAIYRDIFSGVQLAIANSYMSATWATIPLIAPLIGAQVQLYFGWKTNFLILFLYSFFLMFIVKLYLPETKHFLTKDNENQKSIIKYLLFYRSIFKNPKFKKYVTLTTLVFSISAVFHTTAPFIFQRHFMISLEHFSYILFGIGTTYFVSTLLNSLFLRLYPIHKIMSCGCFAMVALSITLIFYSFSGKATYVDVALITGGIFFVTGFIFPNAAALTFENFTTNIGLVAALNGTVQLLGCSIASFLASKFPDTSTMPIALSLTVISVLIFTRFKIKSKA